MHLHENLLVIMSINPSLHNSNSQSTSSTNVNTSHIEEHVNVEKNEYDVKAKQMELEFQEKLRDKEYYRERGLCHIHPTYP